MRYIPIVLKARRLYPVAIGGLSGAVWSLLMNPWLGFGIWLVAFVILYLVARVFDSWLMSRGILQLYRQPWEKGKRITPDPFVPTSAKPPAKARRN